MRRATGIAREGKEEITALWQGYRQTRNPCLKEALIKRYVHLVRFVAGRMRICLPSHIRMEELESPGIVGLLLAVDGFDPNHGVDFSTYAQPRIRGAILDELRKLDPLPRSARQKAKGIERALVALEQQLGRQPEHEEVAAHLGLSLLLIHSLHSGSVSSSTVDQPWGPSLRGYYSHLIANHCGLPVPITRDAAI